MTDNHKPNISSDFPGEDVTPPRRRSESQALIRLQRESADSISEIDGPEIEPLTPFSTMTKKRTRVWLPWVLILLALFVGLLFWIRHISRSASSGPLPHPTPSESTNSGNE